MRVVGGTDVGREFPLRAGGNVLGRDKSADIVLNDSMVSRRHARIDVGASVEVVDLNSANGIEVDGGIVTRATLNAGQVITLGDSQIMVDVAYSAPTAPTATAQGGSLPFTRSPVVEPRYPFTEHARPEIPGEVDKPPFPWLLMIVPVVVGAAAFAFTRNPLSLLFVAMSPLMLASNYLMTRTRNARRLGNQLARFDKQLKALDARLAAEMPRERQVRNDEAPTTTRIVDGARQLNPMLWTRRPEHWSFLHLRLGTGSAPSRNTVAAAGERADGLPELEDRLTEVIERYRFIDEVPIVESLATSGAIGVAGQPQAAATAVQALLAQIVCLHSPAEIVLAAIGGAQTAHDLEWLKWTPHTSAPQSPLTGSHLASGPASAAALLSQLEELVEQRLNARDERRRGPLATELGATSEGGRVGDDGEQPAAPPLPAVVVVIGADAPLNEARAVQLAERSPDAGVFTIWLAAKPDRLPAVCRTFIDVTGPVASIGFVRHGITVRDVTVETLQRDTVSLLGRHLAALTDAGAATADATDLPRTLSMVSLIGTEIAVEPDAVVDRWRQNQSILDRSGTSGIATQSTGRHFAGARRAERTGRNASSTCARRAARARRRHDRLRQERVPAGVGARHGRRRTARTASRSCSSTTRADRGVRRLRRRCRTASASSPTSVPHLVRRALTSLGRAAPPRAHAQPQEGEGSARTREARRPGVPAGARARHRRVRGPGR